MNQPSKWQLRIHLLLVFLLFLIHHCHRPSSGLFVADAWSQGCPWQLHQVGSGAMAPMVQVMPLWPEAFHTAASLTKVSGVCWINKKTNISADPFFSSARALWFYGSSFLSSSSSSSFLSTSSSFFSSSSLLSSSVLFVLVVFLSMYCTICVFKGKKGLLASSHGQVMSSPGLRRSFDPAWPPTVMDDDW